MDSDGDEWAGSHCVMRECYETNNLSLLPNRSRTQWADFIRRHLGKDGWVPTNKTSVCGRHYRTISKLLTQQPQRHPSFTTRRGPGGIVDFEYAPSNIQQQYTSNFTQHENRKGYSIDPKTGKLKKRTGLYNPYTSREKGQDVITEPVIRTEDGEFHVLSVLESTDPTNINCDVDQRVIEPDGSIDGGFGSLNVLPNLAKKSKPYPAMTEHSSKLENEYLRKQLNTYKDRLKSIESEYHMFQKGLGTVFGVDQISYIRRRAIGETQPKGVKWRAETVASAAKMRLEFSDVTYKALVRLGFPFPSIDYMRNYAYKLERLTGQEEATTGGSDWSEDRLTADALEELDREISYDDRIKAEKTTESRGFFHYRAITTTNDHDHLLPNWFTKINLEARRTLLFPEGTGGHRGCTVAPVAKMPTTYSNAYYKASRVHQKAPVSPAKRPISGGKPAEPPKKVVKLVPCAPPDFINNKNIKVTKIDGSKLKLATLTPIDKKLKACESEPSVEAEDALPTQDEDVSPAQEVFVEEQREVDIQVRPEEVATDTQQTYEEYSADDVVETVMAVKEEA